MKFHEILLVNTNPRLNLDKLIELKSGVFELTLNDQLMNKWQSAIDKSIPLLLNNFGCGTKTVRITTVDKKPFLLKLPNFPKNTQEMIIIRCWLEKLFKCVFECACFNQSLFNPELINILFDNDKIISPQFNILEANVCSNDKTFKSVLKLTLNHLSISEFLIIDLTRFELTEQHIDILFNILITEGNKLPKICLNCYKLRRLHDLILKYITTSKDCSKIVPIIIFDFILYPNFKLNERAEEVEVLQLSTNTKSTKYQIANIYNPKVRFLFCNEGGNNGSVSYIQIEKMKENLRG